MVFVRFEDLVNDPEPQYEDMMRFFLGITNIKGTNAERRIKQVIEKGAKATQTYTLKTATRQFNSTADLYTKAQVDFAKEKLKDVLYMFGYAKSKTDTRENFTGFFEYDRKTDEQQA